MLQKARIECYRKPGLSATESQGGVANLVLCISGPCYGSVAKSGVVHIGTVFPKGRGPCWGSVAKKGVVHIRTVLPKGVWSILGQCCQKGCGPY